nr:MAG TPA: hypothetical protein [Bacteriophage sp.]
MLLFRWSTSVDHHLFFLFFLRVFMANAKYLNTKLRHDVLCVYGGHHG